MAMVTMQPDRPALRYYGGKWLLAPWIVEHLPPHICYVEPFCGAASVLLRKPPSRMEAINDVDSQVVNFFEILRTRTTELVRAIQLTPYAEAEYKLAHEPCDDPLERARRLYVRSFQSYGSVRRYRTGWRRQRGDSRRVTSNTREWNKTDHLTAVAWRLKNVQINCADWQTVIERYDSPDTCFYCDPPYLAETRSQQWATTGYRYEMTDDDHTELAEVLNGVQGMVVLSGYQSPLYRNLYTGWQIVTKEARTNGKKTRTECLWLSPAAVARGRQLRLPIVM